MNSVKAILPFVQILLSILLVGAVLLQQSDAGLGSAFGGDGMGGATHTRRGFEKTLFNATIILSCLFALSAFVALIV